MKILLIGFLFSTVVLTFMYSGMASAQDSIRDGLVSYWTFDEADVDGETVKDVFGENHGTMKGNPQMVEGKVGEALEFNGSNDFVEVPNSPTLNIADAVSIMAWIKPTGGYPNQYGHIAGINRVGGQTEDAYYLNVGYYDREHDKVSLGIIGEGVVETPLQGQTQVFQDVWTFVAGVFSPGESMQVYMDGQLDGELTSVPSKMQIAPTAFTMGAIVASTDYSFQGIIDEVIVYRRALTEGEIQMVMKAGPLSVGSAGKLATAWGRMKEIKL